MTAQLFAFYGSLRCGMELHKHFQNGMTYVFSAWLNGFTLHSLGSYPYAVYEPKLNSKIRVDVFELSQDTRRKIHEIETNAGYYLDIIRHNGYDLQIYLFKNSANDPKVDKGDWVEFFGG